MKEHLNSNAKELFDLKKNQEIIDSYDYLENAASVNDCTGLIPAAINSDDELESYMEIYAFEPHAAKNSENDNK